MPSIINIAFLILFLTINCFAETASTDTGIKYLHYPAPVIQQNKSGQFVLNEKTVILFDKASKINADFLGNELRSIGINLQRFQGVKKLSNSNTIFLYDKKNVFLNSAIAKYLRKRGCLLSLSYKRKNLVSRCRWWRTAIRNFNAFAVN